MTIHRFFAANHVYQKETELRKLELMMPQREVFQASYCIKTSYPLRRSPLNFLECKAKRRMIRTWKLKPLKRCHGIILPLSPWENTPSMPTELWQRYLVNVLACGFVGERRYHMEPTPTPTQWPTKSWDCVTAFENQNANKAGRPTCLDHIAVWPKCLPE